MKDLPKVSAFPINKKLNNSQDRFYGSINEESNLKNTNVNAKINSIFSSNNHIYKSRVRIKTKDDFLEKTIIGKTGNNLLTLNGEKINIQNIIDIERL